MIPCLMSSSLSRLRDSLQSRSAVEHKGMSKVQWTKVAYNGHAYNSVSWMSQSDYIHTHTYNNNKHVTSYTCLS